MDHSQHFNVGGFDLIQDAVRIERQFADNLLVEFRHDAANTRQLIEANGFVDQGFSDALSVN